MHSDESAEDEGRPLFSNRSADIVVAILLLVICGIVIYDSNRVGFHWVEGEGPAPGYFPFYVALVLGISSLINLISAIRAPGPSGVFVSMRPFGRVLAVLIPSLVFIALIGGISIGPVDVEGLGIYVASAIFILCFMLVIGRENFFKAAAIAVAVPLALFMMFERWFLVPLPKGPLEAWLGF